MKIKTSELTGAALDWAVAKCEGILAPDGIQLSDEYCDRLRHDQDGGFSTDWSQAGPIIEREKIALDFFENLCGAGVHRAGFLCFLSHGPTPLIAAMRCYVASKLGEDIDVPEELK